ncbi:TPA: hypothetical protein HA317_03040 [Candidatus Woesearchaeota archaeon]|nr:hypothetical protein [Candidatus Woesearchaeota archaeon]
MPAEELYLGFRNADLHCLILNPDAKTRAGIVFTTSPEGIGLYLVTETQSL